MAASSSPAPSPTTNGTAIDLAGMTRGQSDIQDAVTAINTANQNMSEQSMRLQGSWTGAAAVTFHGALSAWMDEANSIKNDLVKILDALAQNTHIAVNADATTGDTSTSYARVQGTAVQPLNF